MKMEYSRPPQYGRKRMSLGNIIGDPFALATTSIATVRIFSLAHPHFGYQSLIDSALACMDHFLHFHNHRARPRTPGFPPLHVLGTGVFPRTDRWNPHCGRLG